MRTLKCVESFKNYANEAWLVEQILGILWFRCVKLVRFYAVRGQTLFHLLFDVYMFYLTKNFKRQVLIVIWTIY